MTDTHHYELNGLRVTITRVMYEWKCNDRRCCKVLRNNSSLRINCLAAVRVQFIGKNTGRILRETGFQ